ncbi:hypothetical protein N7486_000097 [Penicillium sp. IBT 16267x]|nr:hypothetical protein N7486_000097 [Penicillium sp. IBT 16267x]
MSNQHDELAHPHFALIYIDRDGNLRHVASPSIANSRETILSPRVTDAFLQAVARSGEPGPSRSSFEVESGASVSPPKTTTGQSLLPAQVSQVPARTESRNMEGHRRVVPVPQGSPIDPTMWPAQQQEPWPSQWSRSPQNQRAQPWDEEVSITSPNKSLICVRDKEFLRRYYEKVFQNLQQTNCRVLAKAYVKLVEPRKQVNYPYNGRKIVDGRTQQLNPEETKPPWWPAGVSHREPDHLPKAGKKISIPFGFPRKALIKPLTNPQERVRLLVYLLCELRTSYGITARRLREADQPIRRQITPVERLQMMDEVYEVREEEEKFLDGKTGGKTLVSIARANLPDPVDSPSSRRTSPNEEKPIQEPHYETMCIRSGPTRTPKDPKNTYAASDVSGNVSPIPLPPSHRPIGYVKPEPSINRGGDATQSAMAAQDLKRKRQCVGTGVPVPTSTAPNPNPNSLEYYAPVYVGAPPYMPEPYHELHGFPVQADSTPAQPPTETFGEDMDSSTFPFYFQY